MPPQEARDETLVVLIHKVGRCHVSSRRPIKEEKVLKRSTNMRLADGEYFSTICRNRSKIIFIQHLDQPSGCLGGQILIKKQIIKNDSYSLQGETRDDKGITSIA